MPKTKAGERARHGNLARSPMLLLLLPEGPLRLELGDDAAAAHDLVVHTSHVESGLGPAQKVIVVVVEILADTSGQRARADGLLLEQPVEQRPIAVPVFKNTGVAEGAVQRKQVLGRIEHERTGHLAPKAEGCEFTRFLVVVVDRQVPAPAVAPERIRLAVVDDGRHLTIGPFRAQQLRTQQRVWGPAKADTVPDTKRPHIFCHLQSLS